MFIDNGNVISLIIDTSPADFQSVSYSVTMPSQVSAGTGFLFTVTCRDATGTVQPGYAGMVHFKSGDVLAVLPADSVLVSGVGVFTAYLETFGSQQLVAVDANSPNILGFAFTDVLAGPSHLFINFGVNSLTAGTGHSFTIFATTGNGQVDTTYNGTVQFASNDPIAVLPVTRAIAQGIAVLSATLKTQTSRATITATDKTTSSITGYNRALSVTAAPFSKYAVVCQSTATTGVGFAVTLTAQDAYGNSPVSSVRTANITSSDNSAVIPSSATCQPGVNSGRVVFSATLNTVGSQTLSATDSVTSSLTGSAGVVGVSTGSTKPHFVLTIPGTTINSGSLFSVTATLTNSNGSTVTSYFGDATLSVVNGNGESNPFFTWLHGAFPASSVTNASFNAGVYVYTQISTTAGGGGTCQFQVQDDHDATLVGLSPVITFN
jgi:hypothetical protein